MSKNIQTVWYKLPVHLYCHCQFSTCQTRQAANNGARQWTRLPER